MEQPHRYKIQGKKDKVYRLKKVLYRPKQALRAWNSKIDKFLLDHGFSKSPSKPFLYMKMHEDHFLIWCLYVDDLIYISTDARMIENFKDTMMQKYKMTDLRLMKYFLRIKVKQRPEQIFIP